MEDIINYIQNLNNENSYLKTQLKNNENINSELQESINNFTKVSIINNLNKQLKDKINQITLLEKQINKLNNINEELINENKKLINNNKLTIILNKEPNEEILNKEPNEELSKITNTHKKNKDKKIIKETLDDTSNQQIKKKSKKKFQELQYKKIKYLLDTSSNEIYDIINDKPNKIIGTFINKKILFM